MFKFETTITKYFIDFIKEQHINNIYDQNNITHNKVTGLVRRTLANIDQYNSHLSQNYLVISTNLSYSQMCTRKCYG